MHVHTCARSPTLTMGQKLESEVGEIVQLLIRHGEFSSIPYLMVKLVEWGGMHFNPSALKAKIDISLGFAASLDYLASKHQDRRRCYIKNSWTCVKNDGLGSLWRICVLVDTWMHTHTYTVKQRKSTNLFHDH